MNSKEDNKVKVENRKTKKGSEAEAFAFPVELLILSCVMILKWFTVLILKFKGLTYDQAMKSMPKPKEISIKSKKKPPNIMRPKAKRRYKTRALFRLGLIVALNVVAKTPKFMIKSDKMICNQLRPYRNSKGLLKVDKVPEEMLPQIRSIMHLTSNDMLLSEMYEIIVDTGCTNSASGVYEDFVPGSPKLLDEPLQIEGVGGNIIVAHIGIVKWEFISKKGEVVKVYIHAHYAPALGHLRLLSPQACFQEMDEEGEFIVRHDMCLLRFKGGHEVEVPLSPETGLPIVMAFPDVKKTSKKIALMHNLITPDNENLTLLQKELLKWHYRLGHPAFQAVQWIGRAGILGKLGEKWGASTVAPPKCEACQMGKQHRTPTEGATSKRVNEGVLTKEKLKPGELVFSDQFVSSLSGKYHNQRGQTNSQYEYRGGTIFYDAASKYMNVTNQVGFTAHETIEAKLKFEREAQSIGVQVKQYQTDNGIYTSRDFMQCLNDQNQTIKLSGVGGHHHNCAENAIKIIIHKARTMMFHSAICWPSETDLSLWPLAVNYAVHLYNHIPNPQSGLSPMEIWSSSKSSYSAITHAQTWGCPVYVLQPKLQDGQKIPKWEPRSRRGQFVGVSALHASSVGLIRNLRTNNISPQFHIVYDSHFETVHSSDTTPPPVWDELIVFNRDMANFDEDQYVPELTDEWLSTKEIADRERLKHNPKENNKERPSNINSEDKIELIPVDNDMVKSAEPEKDIDSQEVIQNVEPSRNSPKDGEPGGLRRSSRNRAPPTRFTFDKQHGYLTVRAYLKRLYKGLESCQGQAYDMQYVIALLVDPDYGVFDSLPMESFTGSPHFMKAGSKSDPDTPGIKEALGGIHRDDFLEAMGKEIEELEEHETWNVMEKSDVPEGANIIPSTWAFKIKRTPSGEVRKFKARFCVRGDKQIEGVDYFETYAPVVSWSSVRMLLGLTLQYGWATKQVDFSNAFVHATLNEEVYVTLPAMFQDDSGIDPKECVLKLNKSLYGLAQSPRTWYYCLRECLEGLDFECCDAEQGVFFGHGMTIVCWVDDCLFFGPDKDKIEEIIKKIQGKGFTLTEEETEGDVFTFLGVELNRYKDRIVLSQHNLINKVLETTEMTDCNPKDTPCIQDTLGTNADGARFQENWEYASVVGMLMYLCNNAYPEIQFAVHQCARFTHCPRASHAEAIKRICRYLKKIVVLDKKHNMKHGLMFRRDPEFRLECYVDADYAGLWKQEDDQDPICVKSRTGYVMMLNKNPVHWVSKLQTEIALSTTEAEYIALSQAMRELIPMREFLSHLQQKMKIESKHPIKIQSTVFEDNNGCISIVKAPKMTPRTKHIAVKYHFFREHIGEEKGIIIEKIDTLEQIADIFTKGLAADKFEYLQRLLCGW